MVQKARACATLCRIIREYDDCTLKDMLEFFTGPISYQDLFRIVRRTVSRKRYSVSGNGL